MKTESVHPHDVAESLAAARMISVTADRGVAPVLRTVLRLDQPESRVTRAILTSTAHGIYEARLDGAPVSDALFAPGWTAYEWRLQVQEHDVTSKVRDGATLEVLLGNGWWRGELGFLGADLDYGSDIGFIAALRITFEDGSTQLVATDTSWTAVASDVVENDLYDGQRIDARLRGGEVPLEVREVPFDRSVLVPQVKPPVARQLVVQPQLISEATDGTTLVDFGQNLVGWIRLRVRGEEGREVVVRHCEVLEDGAPAMRPLRDARATDTFVLSGGEDVFEPTLTFHGFRYAELANLPGPLSPQDIEAVVVHSTMTPTGTFECSSPLVNQLVSNSTWGQRGNFLDIPTDCPQRDERLGWTGDIAVYAPTATFQFDCADFLHGWLLDLAAEEAASGHVPMVVPNVLKLMELTGDLAEQGDQLRAPTAIWADAAVWVPQALWSAYGDRDRLREHYPAMVRHLENVESRLSSTGLWDTGFQFGDWLDPTAPPDAPMQGRADAAVIATACVYRSAGFVAEAAELLGHVEDSRRWAELQERVGAAFLQHYVDADGRIHSDAPAVYALAICFGLLDEDLTALAGERLRELVEQDGHRVATGFAGTPYVTWALSETGHVDTAYRLLLQTECPSWLYAVTMGATTVWERWDSLLPDGSVNPGEMTSFNHYALGAVCDWLYKVVAGIRPEAPGYSEVRLQPQPGRGLDWARASLDTRHGTVRSGWRRIGDELEFEYALPDGVAGVLALPDGSTHPLTAGSEGLLRVADAAFTADSDREESLV